MTDLTDRMRTCAAHLATASIVPNPAAIDDAAALLVAAANEIEILTGPIDKGEPMEIMTPWVEDPLPSPPQTNLWIAPGGPLPGLKHSGTISPRACPKCDSRAGKRVSRQGTHLMLVCPVCSHAWPYMKEPPTAGAAGG